MNDAIGCGQLSVIGEVGFAAAASADRIYFNTMIDDKWTIASCDIAQSVSGACQPEDLIEPTSQLDFVNIRAMRVVDGALYAAGDAEGAAAVWKIEL